MPQSYLHIVQNYYPKANYSELLGRELINYLKKLGYDPEVVMTANSICSDDISAMQFPHSVKHLLGPFNLGGLDGFPFTGITGVKAFAHHMPENGALLIFYAPHIGISIHDHPEGMPGKVMRKGQDHNSDCCGAAKEAINRIDKMMNHNPEITELDYQEDTIERIFFEHKEQILEAKYPIMEATEVMYHAIRKRVDLLIEKTIAEFKGKLLVLVGGIFINVDYGAKSCAEYKNLEEVDLGTKIRKDHINDFMAFLKK
jgi:hypothetical protein